MTDYRDQLKGIHTFPMLVRFLRDEMQWPIASAAADFEDLTFNYTPEELGIDPASAAKVEEIKQLRRLSANQPWGVFFVKFEPKKLPVVALRRILGRLATTKRATAGAAERPHWSAEDLLFISSYGDSHERKLSFAHFSQDLVGHDLPTLKVLAWDDLDTPLHLEHAANTLVQKLSWPNAHNEADQEAWRKRWRSAFELEHLEVITTSKALAVRLAVLAGRIRARINSVLEVEIDDGPIRQLLKAFQQALVHDLDEDDFADMYAQTIAYGLLSARIADPATNGPGAFGTFSHRSPFLRELLDSFLHIRAHDSRPSPRTTIDFDELGVSDVIALLDRANMAAVVRDFGDRNPLDDPVIHFYELFLSHYDAKKRMQRGVFYTPRPVVSYIVRSVHEVLQSEFGLADGLADTTTWGEMASRGTTRTIPAGVAPTQPFVQVLDPATGTGTFLVEVVDLVHTTLIAKWKAQSCSDKEIGARWNEYVTEHLLPRLHGYEILMAPYAIAHLKMGLKLFETGFQFGGDQRVQIYLTNSLEPANDFSDNLEFAIPALAREAQSVNEVKKNRRFTVVVGNPPYSSLSLNMGEWIKALVKPFRMIRDVQIVEKGKRNHLQDDYVKFFRLALLNLEETGAGVIGLITNHGYLYSPTFRAMRYYIMGSMTGGRILDLNGNAKRDDAKGHPGDENVFDIQQGVAISLMWLNRKKDGLADLDHASLFGSRAAKTAALSGAMRPEEFQQIRPSPEYYLFESGDVSRHAEYDRWLKLDEVMPFGGTGVKTNRDHFVIDFDDEALIHRMQMFRDPTLRDSEVQERLSLGENYTWKISKQRSLFREDTDHDRLRDIEYRPFDTRRIYYQRHVVYNPRFSTMAQAGVGNVFLLLCRQQFETGFRHAFVTRRMFECCVVSAKSREITSGFPLYVSQQGDKGSVLLFDDATRRVNLSNAFTMRLKAAVGSIVPDELASRSEQAGTLGWADYVLNYIYAILYSPGYRQRYAESLKLDFPRVPVPRSKRLFQDLAGLGGEIVALHLMESPKLDRPMTSYTGPTDPQVTRVGWSDNTVWLDVAAQNKSQKAQPGTIGFKGVPEALWNFHIGSYQVCEKWLKDRRGRVLTSDDISHYQRIVVALQETLRIMGEIDKVINGHGGWPEAFVATSSPGGIQD